MKSLIKIITVVSFLFLLLHNDAAAQEFKGTLTVETDRGEALIYINKNLEAKGKFETELNAGMYVVTVVENNKSWDAKIYVDSVLIEPDNHQIRYYFFNSDVYIQTVPDDVSVTRNDSLLGYTPLFIQKDYGDFKLRKFGYEDKLIPEKDIFLNNSIHLSLNDEFAPVRDRESFFEKDLFKYLVGSIVVLGGTTAYFKLKADNRFDEYRISGSKALLDEVDRYDLISGITFAALQINFGILVYYLLVD